MPAARSWVTKEPKLSPISCKTTCQPSGVCRYIYSVNSVLGAGETPAAFGLLAATGARARVSCSSTMSFALLYSVVRFLLDALLTRRQSDLQLQAEVLALRHQLRVLQRQVRRPRWQPAKIASPERPEPPTAWRIVVIPARQPRDSSGGAATRCPSTTLVGGDPSHTHRGGVQTALSREFHFAADIEYLAAPWRSI